MSHSRKKEPFAGITTAPSEKEDKRQANRLLRHKVRQQLAENPETDVPSAIQDVSDPWAMGKDGKIRFDPEKRPDKMRK